MQPEYAAWLDTMPEALRDGPTADALLAVVELDFFELPEVQLPRGFDRD